MLRSTLRWFATLRPAPRVLVLDPPCTMVERSGSLPESTGHSSFFSDDNAAESGGAAVQYCCKSCQTPLFTASHLAEGDSVGHHPSGWPTFLDHIQDAIRLKPMLTDNLAGQQSPLLNDDVASYDTPHPVPSGPTATGRPIKRSFTLKDVACTRLPLSMASRGDHRENRLEMRPGTRLIEMKISPKELNRRREESGKNIKPIRLVAPRRAAAANKMLEQRRKLVLSHLQGHCKSCHTPVCLVTSTAKAGVRLVANPSSLVLTPQQCETNRNGGKAVSTHRRRRERKS